MRAMLGRVGGVAKGMVGGAVAHLGEARAALTATSGTDDGAEVELQLQRISDALMPEYRREAVLQLKELLLDSPQAQLAFGSMGIPVLVAVLHEDRDDLELVKGALECLVAATAQGTAGTAGAIGGVGSQEAQAGAINAELFARRPEHVSELLQLLEDEPVGISDFYVKYHTVQLLTQLLQVCAFKLQAAILASPMGVVRLMDLLGEREVIRNEVLQLLVALTRANEEVQKILAFEGAFDKIFTTAIEEGGAEGGVVVQDCLELLNNLLRGNQANQRLFRDMGFSPQLPRLLRTAALEPPPDANMLGTQVAALSAAASAAAASAVAATGLQVNQGPQMSRQKANILLCALETIMLLVACPVDPVEARNISGGAPAGAEAAARAAAQGALIQAGALEALLGLGLTNGGVPSAAVRAQALHALGDLVASHSGGQDRLASAVLASPSHPGPASPPGPPPPPVPALRAVLHVILHAADAGEQGAAEHLLRAFCSGNVEGQLALVCSITPLGKDVSTPSIGPSFDQGNSFGSELVAALVQTQNLPLSCRAATTLQHLIAGNAAAKQRLLSLPLELPTRSILSPDLLLPRCMRHVVDALRIDAGDAGRACAAVMLRLLVVWLQECLPAIQSLLDNASHLPLLVDLVTGRAGASDPVVSGMAALLLGVCLLYSQPSSGSSSPSGRLLKGSSPADAVLDVVLVRIGLSQFFGRLDDLMRSPSFQAGASVPRLPKPITRASTLPTETDEEPSGPSGSRSIGGASSDRDSPMGRASPTLDHPLLTLDRNFTALVRDLVVGIKQHAMEAFAKPSGSTQSGLGSSGTEGLPTGGTPAEQLAAALAALRAAEQEGEELRARNRALAEDLLRNGGGSQGGGAPSMAGRGGGGGGGGSPADVEARVAAELRASRAELEVARMKQQLELLHGRMLQAEHDAASARESSAQAFSSASKHEAELQDLSAMYNSLESHAFQLEIQVRDLTSKLAAAVATNTTASTSNAAGLGLVPEAEVQRRVEAAAGKARQQAEADGEEGLTDLLVCLGQEEQKVALLRDRLGTYGVDVEALLETIKVEGEDDEEEEGPG